ncbi:hypothetical protein MHU86_22089 [Fragilaria crotonensis]|nr:hypothetical protein MHU86_22089 [Fragilaria crotonensis]
MGIHVPMYLQAVFTSSLKPIQTQTSPAQAPAAALPFQQQQQQQLQHHFRFKLQQQLWHFNLQQQQLLINFVAQVNDATTETTTVCHDTLQEEPDEQGEQEQIDDLMNKQQSP